MEQCPHTSPELHNPELLRKREITSVLRNNLILSIITFVYENFFIFTLE